MTIETTVHISNINKECIIKTAALLNTSPNKIIIKLLTRYLNKQYGNYKTFSRISYQKKNPGDSWKIMHVWFSSEFYEKCLDLRKFHKLSLSNILSLAIKLYLNDIIHNKCDNYNKNYIVLSTVFNNCPIFILTWNYPGEKKTKELLDIYENV